MNSDGKTTEIKRKGWLVVSLMPFIALFGSILYSLPQFERVYEEMMPGEPLPALTRLFCAVPRGVYVVTAVGGVAFLAWLQYSIRTPKLCRRVNVGAALLSVVVFIIYVVALFRPLVGYQGGLGK